MSGTEKEELVRLPGALVARWMNLALQVRRGPLTEEVFDRVAAAIRRHRVRVPRGEVHGVVAVIEEGSSIPTEDVRAKQRAAVHEMLKDPTARFATVIVGEGLEASLLRSASRGVAPSHPQLRIASTPSEAATWLGGELGLDPAEVLRVIEDCRARAALL